MIHVETFPVAPLLLAAGFGATACGSTDGAPATPSLATPDAFGRARASAGEAGAVCALVAGRFACQAATMHMVVGASCGGLEMAVCDPATLFCIDDGMGVCVAAGAGSEGARCTPGEFGSVACAPGLICADATRTCARPAADGMPCRRSAECASGMCNSFANTCEPRCP